MYVLRKENHLSFFSVDLIISLYFSSLCSIFWQSIGVYWSLQTAKLVLSCDHGCMEKQFDKAVDVSWRRRKALVESQPYHRSLLIKLPAVCTFKYSSRSHLFMDFLILLARHCLLTCISAFYQHLLSIVGYIWGYIQSSLHC